MQCSVCEHIRPLQQTTGKKCGLTQCQADSAIPMAVIRKMQKECYIEDGNLRVESLTQAISSRAWRFRAAMLLEVEQNHRVPSRLAAGP